MTRGEYISAEALTCGRGVRREDGIQEAHVASVKRRYTLVRRVVDSLKEQEDMKTLRKHKANADRSGTALFSGQIKAKYLIGQEAKSSRRFNYRANWIGNYRLAEF